MKWYKCIIFLIPGILLGIAFGLSFPIRFSSDRNPRLADTQDGYNNHSWQNAEHIYSSQLLTNLYIFTQDDWFYMYPSSGGEYMVSVDWQGTGDLDVYVYVAVSDNNITLVQSGISCDTPETVRFIVDKSGNGSSQNFWYYGYYFIQVVRFSGPETQYSIQMTFERSSSSFFDISNIYMWGPILLSLLFIYVLFINPVIIKVIQAIKTRRNRNRPINILIQHTRSEYRRMVALDLKSSTKKLHIPFKAAHRKHGRCSWCWARLSMGQGTCLNCGLQVMRS